jgi:outer membrane immunogenic protein
MAPAAPGAFAFERRFSRCSHCGYDYCGCDEWPAFVDAAFRRAWAIFHNLWPWGDSQCALDALSNQYSRPSLLRLHFRGVIVAKTFLAASLMTTLSIGGLVVGSAQAADLRAPAYKAPPPAVAAYSWTGCYVGAGGGYGMFDQTVLYTAPGGPSTTPNDVGGRGWFGTVQVGCDYHATANIVIGAFADYDFSDIKGTWTNTFLAAQVGEDKLKNAWAAGARIGWLASSRLLLFMSGGYTQARFNGISLAFSGGGPTAQSVDKHTASGWFIGSGYEYGLGFLPGLFWKTEYRFADYGPERVAVFGLVPGAAFDQRTYLHTVRSELVWRFNAGVAAPAGPLPAPVAYNWTGCYVGAGGGYGLFNQENQHRNPDGSPSLGPTDIGGRGWFGTIQAGCDYQAAATVVIGAFADYDFADIKGTWTNTLFSNDVGEDRLKSVWAAGARLGWLASSQFLLYVSGGYTQARFDAFNLSTTFGAPTGRSVDEHTASGWFIGSGYEYGLGFLPGLFWKTEYRFSDYGTERVALFNSTPGAGFDHSTVLHTVRSDLVWRFNFGGPVVARY